MEKLENLGVADSTVRVVSKQIRPYQSKGYVIAAEQHRGLHVAA